jgi:tetratricopeptide (TPR) repeat protein
MDKAKMNLERSIQLHSTSPRVNSILAKIYSDEKNYERASEILQNCLTQNSRDKTLNKMLADVFYKRKLYHESIIKYLYVLTLGDTSANTYQRLGMSYYYLSFTNSYILAEPRRLKLEEGIKAFQNAIEKDPDDPVSYLYLGLCFKEVENYEMAITNFEKALTKCFPEYLDEIYSNLAVSYDYSNDYINAIKSYQEALRYQPDKAVTYFYLANLYDRYYKDKEVALLYYQKFVNDSFEPDEKLISYSKERIEFLNKENKFWKGIN